MELQAPDQSTGTVDLSARLVGRVDHNAVRKAVGQFRALDAVAFRTCPPPAQPDPELCQAGLAVAGDGGGLYPFPGGLTARAVARCYRRC